MDFIQTRLNTEWHPIDMCKGDEHEMKLLIGNYVILIVNDIFFPSGSIADVKKLEKKSIYFDIDTTTRTTNCLNICCNMIGCNHFQKLRNNCHLIEIGNSHIFPLENSFVIRSKLIEVWCITEIIRLKWMTNSWLRQNF